MFWRLLAIGISVLASSCAGADYGGLTITSITIQPFLQVCFKVDNPDNAPDGTVFVLTIAAIKEPSTDTEHEMEEDPAYVKPGSSEEILCLKFKGNFVQTEDTTNGPIFILLEGDYSDALKSKRVTDIEYMTLTKLPGTLEGQWVGKKGTTSLHKHTLRIKQDVHDWNICVNNVVHPDGFICKESSGPCYALNIGGLITEDMLSICSPTDDEIPVMVQSIADIAAADETGPVAVNITLEYDSIPKITITSDITEEALVYDNDITIICSSPTECTLTDYEKGNNKLNIILIHVESSLATGSTEKEFQDSDMELYQLAPDGSVFEAKWEKHQPEYFASRTFVDNEEDTFHSVNVDCRDNTVSCFAYFVNVPTEAYPYTVSMYPKDGVDIDNTNKINSKLPKDATVLNNSYKATSISKIMLLQDPAHADGVLRVCYKAHENNSNHTRYEAILIDEDGHWMKIYQSKQENNMMDCFSPVNVLKTSLSVNNANKLTVVIVERELSGNRVLASAKVDLDMTAHRAIKPEVDNGNNGSTSTLAIVGAAIAGIACLVALVAAAVMFVMKSNRDNDGLENQLHRYNIEDSSIIHGLDNPIPTM